MGLRLISRTVEEQNLTLARFGDSRREPAPDHKERQEVQGEIQDLVIQLAELLDSEIEPSRELSCALTHLQEVQMWANKAVFA